MYLPPPVSSVTCTQKIAGTATYENSLPLFMFPTIQQATEQASGLRLRNKACKGTSTNKLDSTQNLFSSHLACGEKKHFQPRFLFQRRRQKEQQKNKKKRLQKLKTTVILNKNKTKRCRKPCGDALTLIQTSYTNV